jgi:hypothetical protein
VEIAVAAKSITARATKCFVIVKGVYSLCRLVCATARFIRCRARGRRHRLLRTWWRMKCWRRHLRQRRRARYLHRRVHTPTCAAADRACAEPSAACADVVCVLLSTASLEEARRGSTSTRRAPPLSRVCCGALQAREQCLGYPEEVRWNGTSDWRGRERRGETAAGQSECEAGWASVPPT